MTTATLTEQFLTVDETAQLLNISTATIARLMKEQGAFPPCCRVGRQIRFRLQTIIDFYTDHESVNQPPYTPIPTGSLFESVEHLLNDQE
jgi:excisionase family DNA binding protein